MRRLLHVALSSLACLTMWATGSFANALSNGDFENGTPPGAFLRLDAGATDIDGWTVLPVQIDYIGSIFPAASGVRSVDLDGTIGVGGGVAQSFPTTIGEMYTVAFAMAGNPAGDPVLKTMTVQAAGQTADFTFDITGSSADDMGWEARTWTFVAEGPVTTLEFISTTGTGFGPMIDDVSAVLTNADVEVFDLPPGPIEDVVVGEPDPRDPKVEVGLDQTEFPPEKYIRRSDGASKLGRKVEAGECYAGIWDGRPLANIPFFCGSSPGIDVWQMSVTLYFPEACEITLEPQFWSSALTGPMCRVPDAALCSGPATTFTIGASGTYTLSMPIDCDCALIDDVYFLTMCVVSKSCTTGPYMSTASSGISVCSSYVDLGTGDGWEDVSVKFPTVPGPFQISGDAVCCENAVGVELRSWGELKSTFGDTQR